MMGSLGLSPLSSFGEYSDETEVSTSVQAFYTKGVLHEEEVGITCSVVQAPKSALYVCVEGQRQLVS